MFQMKFLFYFVLVQWIVATPQLNLLYTDWVSESDEILQHDCLRLVASVEITSDDHHIVSYCMSESSSRFDTADSGPFSKFTFRELSTRNISSEQLYLWSAPIDIIEHYQFYLEQLSVSDALFLATEIYYNCTLPRFGPMCQYELPHHYPYHTSFYQIVYNFYYAYPYNPTNLTCYTHLKCNRGPLPACLDWREICDGKIDCLEDPLDEDHCWQLEINQCKNGEYRCTNGQCIPQSFYLDNPKNPDCFDGSDELITDDRGSCHKYKHPSVGCEDVRCKYTLEARSCMKERTNLLLEAIHSNNDNSVSEDCRSALKCIFTIKSSQHSLSENVWEPSECAEIVENECPDVFYFPNIPILFGDIYSVYKKNETRSSRKCPTAGLYICYNRSDYDDYFLHSAKMSFNNMRCVNYDWFLPQSAPLCSQVRSLDRTYSHILFRLLTELKKYHTAFNYTSAICNRPNMYQCAHSLKCISFYRLRDTVYDCPYKDDENSTIINDTDLIGQSQESYFNCHESNKYIHRSLSFNGYCDCRTNEPSWCEDEDMARNYIRRNISFQTICDGLIELAPLIIDGRNETDETECEQWPCNNFYTRCNGIYNCLNGVDENGCVSYSTLTCSSNSYICVSPLTNQLMCLPIEKSNDGNVDCLGATDELSLCRISYGSDGFYCRNQSSSPCINHFQLCDGYKHCNYGDDEQFCEANRSIAIGNNICIYNRYLPLSNVERLFCDFLKLKQNYEIIYFKLDGMIELLGNEEENLENTDLPSLSPVETSANEHPRCHRGLDLRVWLKNNLTTNTCLCPASYYGNRCQYQSQRISLSMRIRALSDSWQTSFAMVISLIDDSDEQVIHSFEHLNFLSTKDCGTKFNLNLLYSTRPKDPRKQYAIHIDIYEKVSLVYRGSVLIPVTFPFLPVQRLAFIVDIPRKDDKTQSCSNRRCVYGKCIRYSNHPNNVTFCQCKQGWFGRYCSIPYLCTCSSNSLCIGISTNNRSICVCPSNKFGPRCFLTDIACPANDNSTCRNGGRCVSTSDYLIPKKTFVCICSKGFSGNRCQFADSKLLLSFEKSIILSQSIFIHFIEINSKIELFKSTVKSTTFRTIMVRQDSVTIYWSRPFHLVFVELYNQTYHLAVLQETYNRSRTFVKMISPSDRCPHINELFNTTFVRWHLIRRIKYYHLPCQNQSLNLSCFHDEVHFCLCYVFGEQRLANCFNFDHNMTFNCFGQSECENGGQCFQDTPNCPTRSICICPQCFYGARCQFSTSVYGISLDAILGYHILPNASLVRQPFIVQISSILTIIIMVAGLIDGVLSMITFKCKSVCEVGCGLYLLGSSVTTLFIVVIFGLKFWIFILTQMTTTANRSVLLFQCYSIDFLLRVCFSMDQWFNACVAVERAVVAVKGVSFNKRKSKQAAKFIITILFIVVVGSLIHDPFHRRLIDEVNNDDNVKRTWCIVSYQPSLEDYNSVIHTLHFSLPFLMNLISAIILIITQTRQRATVRSPQSYKGHLLVQLCQHKHLLTAPVVLVILAFPRIILSFVSKCMKSTGDSWLFLIAYFISFTPSIFTFVVFILPSKFYKKEFAKATAHYRAITQRYLDLISRR